jgi:hypothetical protein
MAGIIVCILAVCGILTVGFLFIPLAAITALCGLLIAIENKNSNGVWVNVLAWVLVLAGVFRWRCSDERSPLRVERTVNNDESTLNPLSDLLWLHSLRPRKFRLNSIVLPVDVFRQ